MSEYRLLYCIGCDKRIEKRPSEKFNYTETADGPYCDFCWHFILRIEALSQRVSDLEAEAQRQRKAGLSTENLPSPYDAGAKRCSPRESALRRLNGRGAGR